MIFRQFCYRKNTRNVDWMLRARICLDCTRQQYAFVGFLLRQKPDAQRVSIKGWTDYPHDDYYSGIVTAIPTRCGSKRHHCVCCYNDLSR